jgi:hypothetical protein
MHLVMEAIYFYKIKHIHDVAAALKVEYSDVIYPKDFLTLPKRKRTINNLLPKEKFLLIEPFIEEATKIVKEKGEIK